jgi:hypothetical protein
MYLYKREKLSFKESPKGFLGGLVYSFIAMNNQIGSILLRQPLYTSP